MNGVLLANDQRLLNLSPFPPYFIPHHSVPVPIESSARKQTTNTWISNVDAQYTYTYKYRVALFYLELHGLDTCNRTKPHYQMFIRELAPTQYSIMYPLQEHARTHYNGHAAYMHK